MQRRHQVVRTIFNVVTEQGHINFNEVEDARSYIKNVPGASKLYEIRITNNGVMQIPIKKNSIYEKTE